MRSREFLNLIIHSCSFFERLKKARLRVKIERMARLETSTGSRWNLLFTRSNSVLMYPTEKGTVLESHWKQVQDRLHVVFFEKGNPESPR